MDICGGNDVTQITPQELQTWLEWAGKRLLAMPGGHVGPRDYKVQWPEYNQDKFELLEFRRHLTQRAPPPPADEITIVDEIITFPNYCNDVKLRRILHLRSLVHPIRFNHLYSWTKLSKMFETDRRRVARWHEIGLEEVAKKADKKKICLIANYFALSSPGAN